MATEPFLQRQLLHSLYADNHHWLLSWLRQRMGCSQTAADLAQDTFLRVLARDQDLSIIREPRAYLHTVAKGLLAHHWRRRQIEQAYLEALAQGPLSVAPSPESQLQIIETLLEIDRVLAQLPKKVRRAFLWSQLHGLTYAVIAERLGVSERMVKKYMATAMLHCLAVAQDQT